MTGTGRDDLAAVFATAPARDFPAGAQLFSVGDPVTGVFFLSEGQVDLVRHTTSGARLILHRSIPGQVLAEASVYSQRYHCDAQAAGASRVSVLPLPAFLQALERDPALARHWAASLAHALQRARLNAEIRAQRTVAGRLDAWLDSGNEMPPKGQWQSVADTLGVSREALYRELARRG